jgi:hypothetical protein
MSLDLWLVHQRGTRIVHHYHLSTIAATPVAYASDLLIRPPSIEASMFGKARSQPGAQATLYGKYFELRALPSFSCLIS